MRLDRLLAITMHLLNRGTVSAAVLVERFEVSKRTIQRDIEALCQAGIPIVPTYGAGGGYAIMDGFRVHKQVAGEEEAKHIFTALQGLSSAYPDKSVGYTVDKLRAALPAVKRHVFVDLSAAREGVDTETYLPVLDAAIREKKRAAISYTNANGYATERVVEPLALSYQWYAWYLFAYCPEKNDHRSFKLPRISACQITEEGFARAHEDAEVLMKSQENNQTFHRVELYCKAGARQAVLEYLKGRITREFANGDFHCEMHVPFERMWFSLVLGFGGQVRVLSPPEMVERVKATAKEVLELYE